MERIERRRKKRHTASATLEHLTGPARGTASWLGGIALDVSLNDDNLIRVTESAGGEPKDGVVARLHRSGDTYEIEALDDYPLWVNGDRITEKQLEARDLIEFGEAGPLSRYRLYHQGDRVKRSLGDMLSDSIDYTRVSRKPRLARLKHALGDFFRDFALQTTLLFRFGVIAALVVLGTVVFYQSQYSARLQQQAETSERRLEGFARSLTRTSEEALRPADLNRLRQELRHSLTDTAERLEQLEKRGEASARIIADATRSIVFLQGAYGFRDVKSDRMLRYQVDDEGRPLVSLRGQPLLTLEGDGEVAEREFTGTAFVVSKSGALLTNRHVALPWEDDTSIENLMQEGFAPILIRFIGYLPENEKAFPVQMLKASDEADLALLQCSDVVEDLPYLELSEQIPNPGDEVIVMGYPTGLRSMLAQTGDSFLAELEDDGSIDFWEVAERLSKAQFIRPLASRGIIGQRSEKTVVYDAETTHGGSGGPVLDINGNAVAVNTAIIPEYGGSNFGVPAEYARRLMVDAGVEVEE